MCCDDAEMHVRDFRLLLELCRAASLPTRLAALVCIPLSWCIGVGYTCILPAGDAVLSAIVSVTWQPLVIGVLRLGFSRQLQGLIGRLCLTFDVGGLLRGPV
jgi:hypothetical protein